MNLHNNCYDIALLSKTEQDKICYFYFFTNVFVNV